MSFHTLPVELKQAIWDLALPVEEPEVCIIWPLNSGGSEHVAKPLLVDTAFPVLMHVCCEWRDFILLSSKIKFRFSRQAGCQVPFRHFNPEMDALYASSANHELAVECLAVEDYEPGITIDTLAKVRHFAVDWPLWMRAAYWLPEMVFRASHNLRKVSVVFPSSRKGLWNPFQAPARRCRLRRIENPKDIVVENEPRPGRAAEKVSVQRQLDYGIITTDDRAVHTWLNDISYYDETTDWFTGSAWNKEEEKLCLEYEAAAFFHYRRSEDGLEVWEDACENRIFRRNSKGAFPEPPVVGMRGNPEEYRVNDDDDYDF